MSAKYQVVLIFQEHGNLEQLEFFLNKWTNLGQQLSDIQDCSRLLCDGIDSLQFTSTAAFQCVQTRILDGEGRLGRKQSQQIYRV